MKTINTILLVAVMLALSSCPEAIADGMFIAPEGSFVYEPAQQAILKYDPETSTEELTILPHFWGDSNDFAWIIPVPNLPELDLVEGQVFWDLDSITQAVYQSRDGEWNCFREETLDYLANDSGGRLNIISTELIGYYQTMIVSATETNVLSDSLSSWGFLHSGNTDAVTEALDYYVQQGWYFVTMKIDQETLESTAKNVSYYPYSGGLDPVKFTFNSDTMIYPMKISAISADAYTQVNLYVITNHRTQFPGAETYYANKFTSDEIATLGPYPTLVNLLSPGDFMTKLQRRYIPAEMAEDVIITQASNDKEYVMIRYSGLPWTGVLLFGPALVWVAIRRRKLLG